MGENFEGEFLGDLGEFLEFLEELRSKDKRFSIFRGKEDLLDAERGVTFWGAHLGESGREEINTFPGKLEADRGVTLWEAHLGESRREEIDE